MTDTTTTTTAIDGVPAIRRELCYAVYSAQHAKAVRERAREWAAAYAYSTALSALAKCGPLPEGIAPSNVGTTADKPAEVAARAWLGTEANTLLGPE